MEQYIKKSALVAEIKRIFKEIGTPPHKDSNCENWPFLAGEQQMCKTILSFIDTLEVKEVDLEKEYKNFVEEDPVYNKLVNGIVGKAIAKHFFELGLKARKEEVK